MKIFKKAPNTKGTIDAMKTIFSYQGIPEVCQSDNGQPFRAKEMKEFSEQMRFAHKHITPVWPRANGMVKRFNRSMKEAVQAGQLEGNPLREAAQEFVQVYRATPQSAIGESPFTVVHGGRKMKTRLPFLKEQDENIDREKYEKYKNKMKQCSRQRTSDTLQTGDCVGETKETK